MPSCRLLALYTLFVTNLSLYPIVPNTFFVFCEKQKQFNWGSKIIQRLSLDLRTEFPQTEGFSRSNLYYIKHWYEFFSAESEFVHQSGGQMEKINIDDCYIPDILLRVPWKHQVVIVSKCDTTQAALFYLDKVVQDTALSFKICNRVSKKTTLSRKV